MRKKTLLFLSFLLVPIWAMAQEAYAVFNNGTLTFYYDNQRGTRTGDTYSLNQGNEKPGWQSHIHTDIKKAVFDKSFANARPTSTYYWFGSYDTKDDESYEFYTNAIADIVGMEYLNTSNVTNMGYMFSLSSHLTNIDLSHFNTQNVTNMAGMFFCCTSIVRLDISQFDTGKVTNMDGMFYGCSSLRTIYCGEKWICTYHEDDYQYVFNDPTLMFNGCHSLKGEKGTHCSGDGYGSRYAHVDEGEQNPGLLTYIETPQAYAVYSDNTQSLSFYYDNHLMSKKGTVYDIDLNYVYNEDEYVDWNWDTYKQYPEWYGKIDPEYIRFDESFENARPKSAYGWFESPQDIWDWEVYCSPKLSKIYGIEYFNTSEMTDMSGMFRSCQLLTELDVSHFDTRNVTNMSEMFFDCQKIKYLDLSHFDMGKVTNAYDMFHQCGIYSIKLPPDLISINDGMFSSCYDLSSIDIPNSVTSIGNSAFSGCSRLTSINIPNCVTSIGNSAFSGCPITTIKIPNGVTSIGNSAFSRCHLSSIEIPKGVVEIGYGAFSCRELASIIVENGNTVYDSRDNCNAIISKSNDVLIAGCKNTIIPDGVTAIGNSAFSYSGLTSINIPNGVTSIGDYAFENCI